MIAQTYKNLKILIIDDGATDSSGKICDEYAFRDFRIRVIHQENLGLAEVRNIGIRKFISKKMFDRGEYPRGKTFEDFLTIYKYIANAKKILLTDYPFYHDLKRSGSITHKVLQPDV